MLFFPIAFLFKTSAAFQALLVIGLSGLVLSARGTPRRQLVQRLCTSRLRAPTIALLVFGVLLLRSRLNLGFRYALPILPPLCVLAAAGIVRIWPIVPRGVRSVVVVLASWMVLHVASYYPHFLAYVSEYGPGRDEGYRVLVDSSLDWGQGLPELARFMRHHDIPRVYLAYFGTAWPTAYGVDYMPLPSYLKLPEVIRNDTAAEPEWLAVSATMLTGMYFRNDPYRQFRETRPDHVIAHSIYLYRLTERP